MNRIMRAYTTDPITTTLALMVLALTIWMLPPIAIAQA
jgi:hypothetical protein